MNKKAMNTVSAFSNKGGERLIDLMTDPTVAEYFCMGRDMFNEASSPTSAWASIKKPHVSKQTRALDAFNMGWEVGERWALESPIADTAKLSDETYRKYFRLGREKFSRSITSIVAWSAVKPLGRPSAKMLVAFQDGWEAESLLHKGETTLETPE